MPPSYQTSTIATQTKVDTTLLAVSAPWRVSSTCKIQKHMLASGKSLLDLIGIVSPDQPA
jgi:hypothetical protein